MSGGDGAGPERKIELCSERVRKTDREREREERPRSRYGILYLRYNHPHAKNISKWLKNHKWRLGCAKKGHTNTQTHRL